METNTTVLSGLEPLLSMEELAECLDVLVATIYDWRVDVRRSPAHWFLVLDSSEIWTENGAPS